MQLDVNALCVVRFSVLFSFLMLIDICDFFGQQSAAHYLANNRSLEAAQMLPGTNLLEGMVKNYVEEHHIEPRSPYKYLTAFKQGSVFTYSNNFEVSSVQFFRKQEVKDFISAVDASLGIFKYRWGDSALRYLALALFATDNEVLHRKHFNVSYSHPC